MDQYQSNIQPESESESGIRHKHQTLIDRLSARRPSSAASGDASDNATAAFLASFASAKLSIEQSLARASTKSDLDRISVAISELDRNLAQNAYFLPSYELRSCLKTISDLKSSLETISDNILPRKKFSFRSKPLKKEEATNKPEEISTKTLENERKTELHIVPDGPGFRNKKEEILVKNFRICDNSEGDFTLSDLENCTVYLKGRIRALFFCRIKNCRVFTGPVTGSVLIEDVSDSLFMLASHQIRIHHAKSTDFYLRVRSRPIIEDSNGVRFAPYKLNYEGIDEELRESGLGEETGNWANVDDFKWLRNVQSPNWGLISEDEMSEIVDISEFNER
ncbi:hypothetical protein LUZ60_005739 [Juncus effusus]|nr:hypothetical protein LUZ60_005739 [Juncus effusus]